MDLGFTIPPTIVTAAAIGCATAILILIVRIYWRVSKSDPRPNREKVVDAPEVDGPRLAERPAPSRPLFQHTNSVSTDGSLTLASHEHPQADRNDRVFGALTPTLAALFPDSAERREESKRELLAAGYYNPYAWQNYAAIRWVAMMLPLFGFLALLFVAPRSMELPLLGGLVLFTGVGWAFPRVYVRNKAKDRVARIEAALPDMIDMLNMCVSQGLTVSESLRRVSRELRTASPDLAQELRIVCEQSELGTLDRALENFAERTDSDEVRSFTTLLIQTERMGTSITQALAEYSDGFRDSHRQEADRKANSAAFKLLFPTVLCLMPAVYLFLLGPAMIELSNFLHGEGRQILENGQNAVEDLNRDGQPPAFTR